MTSKLIKLSAADADKGVNRNKNRSAWLLRDARSGKFVTSAGKRFAKSASAYKRENSSSAADAIEALKRIGILDSAGELAKPYKS